MALEDIKSPLPPRRFSTVVEEDAGEDKRATSNEQREEVKSEPTVPLNAPLISGKVPNKPEPKNLLLYGGIAVAIIIIGILVFKVLLPKIFGGSKVEESLVPVCWAPYR